MNMLISDPPENFEQAATLIPTENPLTGQALDRTLVEIRSGRRLEKIADSIGSFLHNQVARLEEALRQCQQAQENDRVLHSVLSNFEREKKTWDERRQAEILRLDLASKQLALGWQQLEDERRQWLDERNGR